MPRRIIIHGGFHLTGGAALQHVLRDNRVAMKKHTALRLNWHLRDFLPAARAYSVTRDPAALAEAQDRFDTVMSELPGMPRRTLIMSAEDLAGHLPGHPTVEDYAAAPVLFYAYWESAKKHFPQADIHIHLSTRSPQAWLAAAYAHHVETSDMTLGFEAYRAQYETSADLTGMVAEIASRVPAPVHHAALEACTDLPLGPADPLLDLCELPTTLRMALTSGPAERVDAGADADVLAALLEANRSYADPSARQAAKDTIRRAAGLL